jgi:DNA-binding CsgD family transcriptional regulator
MKKEPSEKILLAINRVIKGEIYVSDRMKQKMLQHLVNNQIPDENSSPLDHLSDRELEVFQLLGNGFATRQIAEQLNLSIKTIESYRENLKLKLNVKTGAELIQHAIQWMKSERRCSGLAPPPNRFLRSVARRSKPRSSADKFYDRCISTKAIATVPTPCGKTQSLSVEWRPHTRSRRGAVP